MSRVRVIGLGVLVAALAGCAGAPQQTPVDASPSAAPAPAIDEQAKAKAQAALEAARTALSEAQRLDAAWQDAASILKEAQAAFAAQSFDKARLLASEARNQAELAVNQLYLGRAKPLLDEAQEYREAMSAEQRQRLKQAEQAYMNHQGKPAYDTIKPLMEQVRAQPLPLAPVTAETYEVQPGDNLWRIAARFKIYGDAYKWPLLLRGNDGEIRDADLIYPGQKLIVDRAASAEEQAAAVEHARKRGRWKVGIVEENDRRYLQVWGYRLRIE